MRAQDAKQIPLRDLLARLGCEPVSEKGADVWYLSPFRAESEASFHINETRNIWFDFGLNRGGNVLDFVMQYFQLGSVSAALRELDGMSAWRPAAPPTLSVPQRRAAVPSHAAAAGQVKLETVKIQPLQHWGLQDYLRGRGIDVGIARAYLQEIYYRARPGQQKPYFALAFPNRMANGSDGYELRSAYFQGVHGPKDLSLVRTADTGEVRSVLVFEGFMDFLSYLTWHKRRAEPPDTAVIVLNGVGMGERAIQLIREMGVREVRLYLDNDGPGRELAARFRQELPDRQVIDGSAAYAGHKDFNAFLQAGRQPALAL